jgi:hypothetical protein
LGGGPPKESTGCGALLKRARCDPIHVSIITIDYHVRRSSKYNSYFHRSTEAPVSFGRVHCSQSSKACLRCPSWNFFLVLLSVTKTQGVAPHVHLLHFSGITYKDSQLWKTKIKLPLVTRSPPPIILPVSVCCLWRGKGRWSGDELRRSNATLFFPCKGRL